MRIKVLKESDPASLRAGLRSGCLITLFLFGTVATAFVALPQNCVSPPPGLIAWWPGDGNANEIVGGHNGEFENGATADGNGLVRQAFTFDGVDDLVYIADDVAFRPTRVTVMAWVKFDSLDSPNATEPGLQYLLFRGNSRQEDSYYEGFAFRKVRSQNQDHLSFVVNSVAGQQIAATSVSSVVANRFYHVAGVYDGNSIRVYLDGQLEKVQPVCFPLDYDDRGILFGSSGRGYDGKLQGQLDEVALWDRALSSDEIAAVSAAGSGGMCQWVRIITQPRSQIGSEGQSAVFSVTAVGTVPLNYQWRSNSVNIIGATNDTLVLSNVRAEFAGFYSVVISSVEGNTVSAPALLTINPAGVSIALYAGVKIQGVVGQTYGIRSTTNPGNSNLWPGYANFTLTSPAQVWYDDQSPIYPQRFYKIVSGPIPIP